MSTKQIFLLYCTILVLLSLMLISFSWNANTFFAGAYQPVVQKSVLRKEAANRVRRGESPPPPSNQPRAAGLREIEIQKNYGERYSTY